MPDLLKSLSDEIERRKSESAIGPNTTGAVGTLKAEMQRRGIWQEPELPTLKTLQAPGTMGAATWNGETVDLDAAETDMQNRGNYLETWDAYLKAAEGNVNAARTRYEATGAQSDFIAYENAVNTYNGGLTNAQAAQDNYNELLGVYQDAFKAQNPDYEKNLKRSGWLEQVGEFGEDGEYTLSADYKTLLERAKNATDPDEKELYNELLDGGYATPADDKELQAGIDYVNERLKALRAEGGNYTQVWDPAQMAYIPQENYVRGDEINTLEATLSRMKLGAAETKYEGAYEREIEKLPQNLRGRLSRLPALSEEAAAEATSAAQLNIDGLGAYTPSADARRAQSEVSAIRGELKKLGYTTEQIEGMVGYYTQSYNADVSEKIYGRAEKKAEERNGFGNWLASVVSGIGSGAQYVDLAGQKLLTITDPFTGEKTPLDYHKLHSYDISQGTMSGQQKKVFDRYMSKYGDEEQAEKKAQVAMNAYQLAVSMGQSALIMAGSAIGLPATTLVLGASSATDTAQQMHEQGYDDNIAMLMGAVAGAAEYFTEKYSVEQFFSMKNATSARAVVGNVLRQMLSEGSEEVASDLINTVADMLVMGVTGNENKIEQAARNYERQGLSTSEAEKKAAQDWVNDTVQSFIGGAVSGGLFGIAHTGMNLAGRAYNDTKTGKQYKAGDYASLQKLLGDKGITIGENATNQEVGKAVRTYGETTMQNAVKKRLTELGEARVSPKLLSAIESQATGQRLDQQEQNAMKASTYGAQVASEYGAMMSESPVIDENNRWAVLAAINERNELKKAAGLKTESVPTAEETTDTVAEADNQETENKREKPAKEKSYTETAQEYLDDPEKLNAYQLLFGDVQGKSRSEQVREVAENLHKADVRGSDTIIAERYADLEETKQAESTETVTEETKEAAEEAPKKMNSYVRGLIKEGTPSAANEILRSEENRQAYEELTGETLPGSNNAARSQIAERMKKGLEEQTENQEDAEDNEDVRAKLQEQNVVDIDDENGKIKLAIQEGRNGWVGYLSRDGQIPTLVDGDSREEVINNLVDALKGVNTDEQEVSGAGRGDGNDGVGAGGADGGILEGEDAAVPGGAGEVRQGVGDRQKTGLRREVSPAELGIKKGSTEKITLQENGEQDERIRRAGYEPVPFSGNLYINDAAVNGWVENGRVYYRTDATDSRGNAISQRKIVSHELFHARENESGIVEMAREIVRDSMDTERYEGMKAAYREAYAKVYDFEGMSEEEIADILEQEICADAYAGLNWFNEESPVTREVRQGVAQTLAEEQTAVKPESTGPPEGKATIETLEDGRKYVKADRQVIFGSDPDSWGDQIEGYINRKIRKGEDVTLTTEDGDELILTRDTAGKASSRNLVREKNGRLRPLSDEEYMAKINAEAHIDELATVSRKSGNTSADELSIHGKMAEGGWQYRTAFFRDFDGSYYKVTISTPKGEQGVTVYNVGKMERRAFPSFSGSSAVTQRSMGENSSASNVPQTTEEVKRKVSTDGTASVEVPKRTAEQEDAVFGDIDKSVSIPRQSREEATRISEEQNYPILLRDDGTRERAVPGWTWVRAKDRGNYGYISGSENGLLDVTFVNKNEDISYTKEGFAPGELTVVDAAYQDEDKPIEEPTKAQAEDIDPRTDADFEAIMQETEDRMSGRLKRAEEALGANTEEDNPYDIKEVKEVLQDDPDAAYVELAGVVGEYAFLTAAKPGKGGNFSKTLDQNMDDAFFGDAANRAKAEELIVKPVHQATDAYNKERRTRLTSLHKAVVEKIGIQPGSMENRAIVWYGEGVKQGEGSGLPESETAEYTLEDLKAEFPQTWTKVVAAEKYFRTQYDEMLEQQNASRAQVYPKVVERAKADVEKHKAIEERYNKAKQSALMRLQEIRRSIRLREANAANTHNAALKARWEAGLTELRVAEDVQLKTVERMETKAARARTIAANIQAKIDSGEIVKNKYITPRKDYFHHGREMAQGMNALKNLLTTSADIDSTLAPMSEFTKPKAKWQGHFQHRGEAIYNADAIGDMMSYIDAAAYVTHIDPAIARLRKQVEYIAENTAKTRNANKMLTWLSDQINQMAGKTNPMDRFVTTKIVGRKALKLMKWVNGRVKANAVMANARSAVAQFFNLQNIVMHVKDAKDWKAGAGAYIDYLSGDASARELINQSGFLAGRFGVEDAENKFEKSDVKKFAAWMMRYGDETVAKLGWFAAYEKAVRENAADPIYTADDIIRRSVAGRGIGEVPLVQDSEITKFMAPFQVEVNNTWQLVKSKVHQKDWGALALFALVSYLMNEPLRELFGFDVSWDPINAAVEAAESVDEDDNAWEATTKIAGRLIGETIGNMPYGAQVAQFFVSDENQREKIFGDTDPSRYGTGNIGINMLTDPLLDLVTGDEASEDLLSAVLNIGLPYGGKQTKRIIDVLKTYGLAPDVSISTKSGVSAYLPKTRNGGASYTDSGRLRFAVGSEWDNALRAMLFGTFSTKEGMDYIENGSSPMSDDDTAMFRALVDEGVNTKIAADAIKELNAIKKPTPGVKRATGENQLAAMEYLASTGMTQNQQEALYRESIASDTQIEDMDAMAERGMDWQDISDTLTAYYTISQQDISANEKATQFASWAMQNLTMDQAQTVRGSLTYASGFTANTNSFDAYVDAGLDPSKASEVTMMFGQIVPENGKDQATDEQKMYSLSTAAYLSNDERYMVQGAMLGRELTTESGTPTQYAKMVTMQQAGLDYDGYIEMQLAEKTQDKARVLAGTGMSNDDMISVASTFTTENQYWYLRHIGEYDVGVREWADMINLLPAYDANQNGSYTQEEVKAALDAMRLSDTQRAALWQMQTGGSKNPYDPHVGTALKTALGTWKGK